MPVDSKIIDGKGSNNRAKVFDNGAVFYTESAKPPFGLEQTMRVFRQFLTVDGTASGSNDMRVDGSVTPVDFYVPASSTKDRYISALSFVIADAGQTLNEFANLNVALTNGCRLFYEDVQGEVDIHNALRTNFNFIRLCLGDPAFGDSAGAFRASNVSGLAEGYLPVLDIKRTFGFRWGLRLAVGSNQRIVLRVRDLISNLLVDQFDCIAYGFELSE